MIGVVGVVTKRTGRGVMNVVGRCGVGTYSVDTTGIWKKVFVNMKLKLKFHH